MNRVKVKCAIQVYEIDGRERDANGVEMIIHSHGTWSDRVVITIDGKQYTIVGADLATAIQNAMNTR